MKKNVLKIAILTLSAISMVSCSTLRITNSEKKVDKVESIALISTMIGKIQQPIFPLIDAAAFNSRTNSIADQIMDAQKKSVDKCRDEIAASLKNNFNCNVLFADALHALPAHGEIRAQYNFKNALRTENDNYPHITLATNDVNPFPFEKGKALEFFIDNTKCKKTMSDIAQKLNTDLVAYSYSTLSVVGVGPFGVMGNLRLDTHLFLFDKDGDLITRAQTWSKPVSISGSNVIEYSNQFQTLSSIIEPMMNKIAVNYHQ